MKKQYEITLNQNNGEYYGKLFIEANQINKVSERVIDVDGLIIQYSECVVSINVLEKPKVIEEYPALSELFYFLQKYNCDAYKHFATTKKCINDKFYLEIDLLFMQLWSSEDYFDVVKELEKYADLSLTKESNYVTYPNDEKKEVFYIPLNK